MKKQTLGSQIAALRKAGGMTQQALAEQMGVTDKAVSKWERDLACPDVASLPHLAQVLGVSVEELMEPGKVRPAGGGGQVREMVCLILKAIPLAMGVAVTVLSAMGSLDAEAGLGMLGLGLACLALGQLQPRP
ncbi:MAG: helix-turn-helix transcriptional regulator [Eubacteriales bacterium]|nr:helix-turn-helix transcriptional regulator [Eubacteriales bacterium]